MSWSTRVGARVTSSVAGCPGHPVSTRSTAAFSAGVIARAYFVFTATWRAT